MEDKVQTHEIITRHLGWSLSVCVKLPRLLESLNCWALLLVVAFGVWSENQTCSGSGKRHPTVLMCLKSEFNVCVQNSTTKVSSPQAKTQAFLLSCFTCRTSFHFAFCILTFAQQRCCFCSWQMWMCLVGRSYKRAFCEGLENKLNLDLYLGLISYMADS